MLALKTWGSQKWKNLQWMHWSNAGDRSCMWLTVNSWWRCVCEIGSCAWCSESRLFLNSIVYAEKNRGGIRVDGPPWELVGEMWYILLPTWVDPTALTLQHRHCFQLFGLSKLHWDKIFAVAVSLPQLPPEWKKAVGSLWHNFIAQLFCWLHST